MNNWFVAHTQPLKEAQAQEHLLEQGFKFICRNTRKTRRHARKNRNFSAAVSARYIFVALDLEQDCWRRINGTRGGYILCL